MKLKKIIKQCIPPILLPVFTKRKKSEKEFDKLFYHYESFPRYTDTTLHFDNLILSVSDALSVLYQIKSIFLDEIYRFDSSDNDKVIIDCGANIGLSLIYFKKIYPEAQIVGFEADPTIFSYLKKNMTTNSIDVEIVNKAIWTHNNGVCFIHDGADGGRVETEKQEGAIPSIRLKEILKDFEKVTMLKIDIEGAEYEVLKDCSDELKHVENLFIEYHSFYNREQMLDELLAILKKSGFRYYMNTINKRITPFIKQRTAGEMDLQIEIFCYK